MLWFSKEKGEGRENGGVKDEEGNKLVTIYRGSDTVPGVSSQK